MRILLADDHALFLEGFVLLLKQHFPDSICDISHSYYDVLQKLEVNDDNVDLLLIDWNMPGMQGLESLSHLQKYYPALPICVISAEESRFQIDQVLSTGISGYIPKSLDCGLMKEAIEVMLEGEVFVPTMNKPFFKADLDLNNNVMSDAKLTKRQLEVINLLAIGWGDKAISYELGITELTLRSHLKDIFKRLEVKNRTEASNKARQLGFLSL